MKVLAILPEAVRDPEDAVRACELVRKRYPNDEVHFAAPEGRLDFYSKLLAPLVVYAFRPGQSEPFYNELVVVIGRGPVANLSFGQHQRVYLLRAEHTSFSPHGGFSLHYPQKYDDREHPWRQTHIFHQLGSQGYGFQNFAYGCLYVDPEIGPIDPFGFRIASDYRHLAQRDPNHKLVTVFGGSASFSCLVMYDEMFSSVLERKLNQRGGPYRYTVLNFGMHDHVVMQEMFAYLMFVQPLRPDIVISHGGHNDEWYGMQDDRFLLNHHQIIYPRHTEEWSKLIHKTHDIQSPPLYSTTPEIQSLNLPQKVVQAYISRKQQFKTIVEANGGTFLWGHQPLIWSKGELSSLEDENRRSMESNAFSFYLRFKRRLKMIHPRTSDELAKLPGIRLIDLHRRFKALGGDVTHFWDHVHYSPAGDEAVAQIYCESIAELEAQNFPPQQAAVST